MLVRHVRPLRVQRAEEEWPLARRCGRECYLDAASSSPDAASLQRRSSSTLSTAWMGKPHFSAAPFEEENKYGRWRPTLYVATTAQDADRASVTVRATDTAGKEPLSSRLLPSSMPGWRRAGCAPSRTQGGGGGGGWRELRPEQSRNHGSSVLYHDDFQFSRARETVPTAGRNLGQCRSYSPRAVWRFVLTVADGLSSTTSSGPVARNLRETPAGLSVLSATTTLRTNPGAVRR